MGKIRRKQEKRLEARIASYEEVSEKNGYTRPGSQNLHKQAGGTKSGGGRKR